MKIKTYTLIINKGTGHTRLQVKETFCYEREEFTSPVIVAEFMRDIFKLHEQADEFVYMLAFNTKMRLLGIFEISHGTGNASLLDARGVFMRALQIGANQIMLVHNHPSGKTTPSQEDLLINERIKNAGNLMNIPLIDHVIIGGEKYVSFSEDRLM